VLSLKLGSLCFTRFSHGFARFCVCRFGHYSWGPQLSELGDVVELLRRRFFKGF